MGPNFEQDQKPRPQQEWLVVESHGDPELRRLLELKEAVMNEGVDIKQGLRTGSLEDVDMAASLLNRSITSRQKMLGINPQVDQPDYVSDVE